MSRKQQALLLTSVGLLLASALCFGLWFWLSGLLKSQREAERWQGDGEMPFSQISCFLPADEQIGLKEISAFRNDAMKKLQEASQDVTGAQRLLLDAWSTTTSLSVSSDRARGDAAVIAVGGDFFDFHPLRLLSGDYIRQSNLMHDRVLLDQELAWLLYGGTDLQGMSVKINGIPFVVAGVVEREKDFASRRVYKGGMGLFMSYDTLLTMDENAMINCYEFVLADPVKDFALNVAREKFPIGRGVILCNNTRYQYGKLMDLMLQYGSRSTQTTGTVFPYWENAARMTEDWAGLCCMLGTVLLVFPAITFGVWFVGMFRRGKEKVEEEAWPEVKDRAEEAIRVRQRRRWERRQRRHEKR
ncbi:MAG: ABC transporter permease [Oscillospiraceae bacterium]|nr:ABC transporter permease [Oscillospiraceae bacterium]